MGATWQNWYRQQQAKLAYRHGCTYARKTNYKRAIATFTRALAHHPHPVQVHIARGVSYRKLGQLEQALSDFNIALEIDPFSAEAHGNRGLLRYEQGDAAGALADWAAALVQSPNYAEVYYSRGLVHAQQQRLDAALSDFNRALDLNPNWAEAYYHRGNLHEQRGDAEAAIKDWELALRNDLTFTESKTKLHQQQVELPAVNQALSAALQDRQLTLKVSQTDQCIDISLHRQVGVGINYFKLPDLIRDSLVPLELPSFTQFRLICRVGEVQRAEWDQVYDLYKGQPCPPSNWQSAFSTLVTCPPFGITALVLALQVQKLYQRGAYPDALQASKAVRRLSHVGASILCATALIPLSYTAYTSFKTEPTPPARTARSVDAPMSTPASSIKPL